MKPRSEIRTVTPEWALSVLEKHDKAIQAGTFKQRDVYPKTVELYASDMRTGNWALNGQGISFDVNGNLIDGQHRLYAVCKAKVSVEMLIIWDLPVKLHNSNVKTMDTLDTGRKRTLAHQMKIEGMTNTAVISSAARLITLVSKKSVSGFQNVLTNAQGIQVCSLINDHCQQTLKKLYFDQSSHENYRGYIIAPLVMLRSADPDTADLFASEFAEMANLSKTSPILLFRRFLGRASNVKGGSEWQLRAVRGMASALWAYSNDKKLEYIKGSDEHMGWLLSTSKGLVTKVREIIGEK